MRTSFDAELPDSTRWHIYLFSGVNHT